MPHPLLSPTNTFNRSAIMARAWSKARNSFKAAGNTWSLRACFASALRYVWDEARSARSYAVWAAEQDAAQEAAKLLDARTREIQALRFERVAAAGIDSTRHFLAEVGAIDARLQQLGA